MQVKSRVNLSPLKQEPLGGEGDIAIINDRLKQFSNGTWKDVHVDIPIRDCFNNGNLDSNGNADLLLHDTYQSETSIWIPWSKPIATGPNTIVPKPDGTTGTMSISASVQWSSVDGAAWRAMDGAVGSTANGWRAGTSSNPQWWQVVFPYPIKIYDITHYNTNSNASSSVSGRFYTNDTMTTPIGNAFTSVNSNATALAITGIPAEGVITDTIYFRKTAGNQYSGIGEIDIRADWQISSTVDNFANIIFTKVGGQYPSLTGTNYEDLKLTFSTLPPIHINNYSRYTNIASQGTSISGGTNPSSSMENAFDNDLTTSWVSSQIQPNIVNFAYIGKEFASPTRIDVIRLLFSTTVTPDSYYQIAIQTYDGTEWSTLKTIQTSMKNNAFVEVLVNAETQGIRAFLTGTNTANGNSFFLREFQILQENSDGDVYLNTSIGNHNIVVNGTKREYDDIGNLYTQKDEPDFVKDNSQILYNPTPIDYYIDSSKFYYIFRANFEAIAIRQGEYKIIKLAQDSTIEFDGGNDPRTTFLRLDSNGNPINVGGYITSHYFEQETAPTALTSTANNAMWYQPSTKTFYHADASSGAPNWVPEENWIIKIGTLTKTASAVTTLTMNTPQNGYPVWTNSSTDTVVRSILSPEGQWVPGYSGVALGSYEVELLNFKTSITSTTTFPYNCRLITKASGVIPAVVIDSGWIKNDEFYRSWFREWSDGFKEGGGKVTLTGGSNAGVLNYPIEFSTIPTVLLQPLTSNAGIGANPYQLTSTSCKVTNNYTTGQDFVALYEVKGY